MKRISSMTTVLYKKGFPLVFFGGLVLFLAQALSMKVLQYGLRAVVIVPFVMAVMGFFALKELVWDLMDEVHDCGDSLLVRKGGDEERIPLHGIVSVDSSVFANPPRITLVLLRPGRFGTRIAFSPPWKISLNPFARHPLADNLSTRAEAARRGGGIKK